MLEWISKEEGGPSHCNDNAASVECMLELLSWDDMQQVKQGQVFTFQSLIITARSSELLWHCATYSGPSLHNIPPHCQAAWDVDGGVKEVDDDMDWQESNQPNIDPDPVS